MGPHNNLPGAALLLKGAAVVFALTGLGIAVWAADKAIRYPDIHASQAGHIAPLWVPMILFVLGCSAAVAFLFLRAAQRISDGEITPRRRDGSPTLSERSS